MKRQNYSLIDIIKIILGYNIKSGTPQNKDLGFIAQGYSQLKEKGNSLMTGIVLQHPKILKIPKLSNTNISS